MKQSKNTKASVQLKSTLPNKILESLMLEHQYYTSIANMGNILRERAKITKVPEESDRLFEEAIEKYRESLAIHPRHVKAQVYWAQLLMEHAHILKIRAKRSETSIAEPLQLKIHQMLTTAKELCIKSLEIKSNYHLAGFTLADCCLQLGQESDYSYWLSVCKKWTGYSTDYFRYRRLSVRSSFSILCGDDKNDW